MWGAKLRKARYGSTTTDATATFAYHEPHSLLATMIFAGCKWRENHTPRFLYVYAWNNCHLQLHRAMPINPLLLEEFYPCSKRILFCNHVQQTYSLHKATSTYTSHVLVSASLQVAIPTKPSCYLFVSRKYTLLGTYSTMCHWHNFWKCSTMWVTSRLLPGSAVMTQFQCWLIRIADHNSNV